MVCFLLGLCLPSVSCDSVGLDNMFRKSETACLYWLAIEENYLKRDWVGQAGRVVEVTEETVTIRCRSGFRRTFEASVELASKGIPLNSQQPHRAHRLNQVRVGDFISFYMVRTARGHVITALGIRRRPGGVIPPSEDEHLPEKFRAHNVFNRGQNRELVEEFILPKLKRVLPRVHF